jgi:hypothetical protein
MSSFHILSGSSVYLVDCTVVWDAWSEVSTIRSYHNFP